MKTFARLAFPFLALALLIAPVSAQEVDMSGQWTVDFDTPDFGPVTLSVVVAQSGATFEGAGEVMGYGLELSDGVVEDSGVKFLIHVNAEGQWITLDCEGVVAGDEMTGSLNIEGMGGADFKAKKSSQ